MAPGGAAWERGLYPLPGLEGGELGLGRDLGLNPRVASEGHFWARQASKGPEQPCHLSLPSGSSKTVWWWRRLTGIPSLPRVDMGCSIAPPRDHSWVHLEKHWASKWSKTCKGCMLREPWIQQAPSSPRSRFLEEGCFPRFDASATMTVGPGSQGPRVPGAPV